MGFFLFNLVKRLLRLIIKVSLFLAVLATVIVLIPNLPPYTKFTSIDLTPTQARVGSLAPNDILNNAQKVYKGKLLGPEAFQVYNGDLYTSLATGEIVKVSPGGHVTFVTKIGQPCSGLVKEHICGRPLGFQIDNAKGQLYVADAYHGIWKVDLKTDKKQLLVSPRVEIEKRQPKLFNSLALAQNGDLYWTDSSSDFHLKDGAISVLTDPSGRVFHYNAAKNESKVLVDDLWFPNGVALSPNKEFIVIAETSRYQLLKHYITGPKKGQTEVLVDGLPGIPDNIRALPDGSGLLVGLYTVFDDEHPLLTRTMSKTPAVRKFLARLQRLIEIPFEYLNNQFPHIVFEEIVYSIGHFKSVSGLVPAQSGLLQVDWNGKIIASYYNTDGSLSHISDAIVYNGKLYTGNPHAQDFIGAVPVPPLLKKAFDGKIEAPKVEKPVATPKPKAEPPKEQPKPKVEQPKPKVEQPKPKVEQPKPKVEQPKPKVEQPKPKVEEKKTAPKVETKPKVEQKPKEEKKEAPKVAKPAGTKPAPAKPVETVKTAQKPAEKKPVTPPKATPPPVKVEPAKAKSAEPKATTPKPEVKTTPPPKPAAKTAPPSAKPTPKPADAKKDQKKAPVKPAPKPAEAKPKPEQIPIREEIPSDTAKPSKETLKVIKKDGPAEIPVPQQ